MTTLPANPLQSLLAAAAKKLPATTGATAAYRGRHEHAGPAVILADVSQSMNHPASRSANGARTKLDVLREAIAIVRREERLVAFGTAPSDVEVLPERAAGSTALHLALDHAARWRPGHTLVISDGQPDDEALALAAAARLTGVIDVLHVGPDTDRAGIAFLTALARAGQGRFGRGDLLAAPALAARVQALLPAQGGRK